MWIRYLVCGMVVIGSSLLSIAAGFVSGKWAYLLYARSSHLVLKLLKIQVDVIHAENSYVQGPYVFVGLNQESPLETFLWPASIPFYCRYFLNIEFALIPFVGWSFWAMRNYIIVRSWKQSGKRAVERAATYLQGHGDRGFCIQLDGYMKSNDQLGPYKKGPIVLAIKAKAKLVPVAIHGAKDLLARGEFWVKRGRVQIRFLRALDLSGKSLGDADAILGELKAMARGEFPSKIVV